MAFDRKPRFKSRAALEGSTALPVATAAVLDDAGQHATELAAEAVSSLPVAPQGSARRAGRKAPAPAAVLATPDPIVPADLLPDPVDPAPAMTFDDPAIEPPPMRVDAMPPVQAEPVPAEPPPSVEAAVPQDAGLVGHAALITADLAETIGPATRSSVVQIRAETAEAAPAVLSETRDGTAALSAFNAKMADAMRVTVEDSMSFVTALLAVRSLPEAVSLNTEHLNRRMATLATQGRELTMLAQEVAMGAWRSASIG